MSLKKKAHYWYQHHELLQSCVLIGVAQKT